MSQFQIDPESVAPLPALLHDSVAPMVEASTLSSPDTGASTATTRAAVDKVTRLVALASGDVDDLSERITHAVDAYRRTDGEINWALDTLLAGRLA
ncbi:hypothetical protein [Nocardioides sp. AE5]|uniref:hypothetical protein n=1 Tax=Nocardioides sp. AE5 TaxID=2962573 RepID=UPI002880FE0D|nr:hypothetical protein [Nocardioides sp. AE5]MDT0203506.1 hypothetical protein [Nocardioides sp. AE5]